MTWDALLSIIRDEVDAEACQRIEARVRQELAGLVLYVPTRAKLTQEDVAREVRRAGGRVDLAAARLGVSKATCYRKLQPRHRIVR